MRKNALIICSYTCGAAAFGAFFRWLQNQLAFDAETGLQSSASWGVIVVLIILLAAALFYFLLAKLKTQGLEPPATVYTAFRGTTFVFPVIAWFVAALMVIGGIVALINLKDDAQPLLFIITAVLAIFTGLGFPMICMSARSKYSPGFVSLLMTLPILTFAFWLIACYKLHSTAPTVWTYAVEIIALSAALIAFFYTAGYPYGRPKPYKTIFMSMFAAFMCIMTLADSRHIGLQICMVASAFMLLMEAWMIVSNMRHPEQLPEEPEADENVGTEPAAPEAPAVSDEPDDPDADMKEWKGSRK